MKIRKALFILFFILASVYSHAQQKGDDARKNEKIILYNFYNAANKNEFAYYSSIVPVSISAELQKNPHYTIQIVADVLEYIDTSVESADYKNRILLLAGRGRELNADYIITGSYYIENKTIFIKTQLFDVWAQKITDVHESSDEAGAFLMVIIDQLSGKFNSELQKSIDTRKAEAVSPFSSFYAVINGFAFGINYGLATPLGAWNDRYNKTDIITLYLSYTLSCINRLKDVTFVRNIGFSADYDFFSTDNDKKESEKTQRSYLDVRAYTFSLTYRLVLSSFFFFNLSAGAGYSQSKTDFEASGTGGSSGPPQMSSAKKTNDIYINGSIGVHFLINNLHFSSGMAFKRINYSGTPMNMTVLFFGIGYTI